MYRFTGNPYGTPESRRGVTPAPAVAGTPFGVPAPPVASTPAPAPSAPFGDDMYNFSNPRRIGPGAWTFMHVIAMEAEGKPEELRLVIRQIAAFCEAFKCGDCRGHCKEYMTLHPPINVIHLPYGLFYWTVEFRNAVNRRLNKPTYDPRKMFDIFSSRDYMVCQTGCGGEDGERSETSGERSETNGEGTRNAPPSAVAASPFGVTAVTRPISPRSSSTPRAVASAPAVAGRSYNVPHIVSGGVKSAPAPSVTGTAPTGGTVPAIASTPLSVEEAERIRSRFPAYFIPAANSPWARMSGRYG